MRLEDKVVVVTGAARGIGLSIATRALHEGAVVVAVDVVEDRLADAVNELGAFGPVTGVPVDISSEVQVRDLFREVQDRHGRLDVLINNAGIAKAVPFLDLTSEEWDRILSVNLRGSFVTCQEALRLMVPRGEGAIVNVASTNGLRGQPLLAPYNASKAGLISLTRTLAVEFATNGINVNCVCPGAISTQLNLDDVGFDSEFLREFTARIPMQAYGHPEDIAAACVFLASSDGRYITGQTVVVDGGLMARQ